MVNLEQHSPMRMQAIPMAGGDAGVHQTIRKMRELIEHGKKDPVVHDLAAKIIRQAGVPAFDWMGEVRAIGEAVHRNIRFTRDVYGKETLHAAREIIRLRIGDCDDYTILICSLLGTIGVRTRIVTVSNNAEDPDQFSHVFPEAEVEGEWVPVDFARRNPVFGQGVTNFWRRRVWSSTSDDYVDISGLNGFGYSYPPTRLPVAYRPNSLPAFRNLSGMRGLGMGRAPQGRSIPMSGLGKGRNAGRILGQGNYGVKAMRMMQLAMGQDDSTFDDIASGIAALTPAIAAGATGAANIITASDTGQAKIITAQNAATASTAALTEEELLMQQNPLSSLTSNPTLLLLLIGGVAVIAMAGRHGS